jgi:predicted DNA-binding ribbon-helix-helix protein
MKSLVARRCVVVADHKTSVSVEGAFWNGLKEIARGRNITLSELVEAIDSERRHGNLSSAIRLFVLDFYRNQLAEVQAGPDGAKGNLAIKPESVVQSA